MAQWWLEFLKTVARHAKSTLVDESLRIAVWNSFAKF